MHHKCYTPLCPAHTILIVCVCVCVCYREKLYRNVWEQFYLHKNSSWCKYICVFSSHCMYICMHSTNWINFSTHTDTHTHTLSLSLSQYEYMHKFDPSQFTSFFINMYILVCFVLVYLMAYQLLMRHLMPKNDTFVNVLL